MPETVSGKFVSQYDQQRPEVSPSQPSLAATHYLAPECRFGRVTFQDNGIGIDFLADKHLVFKPFYQVGRLREGKGMGLYIGKSMLEMNGGKIEVSSQVSHGTTFTPHLKEY